MVEIVGCSTSHPGKAWPMTRTCTEVGCTEPVLSRGRCSTHYQRWRRSDAFVPALHATVRSGLGVCPLCGPWERQPSQTLAVCPTCDLTAGEHAYRARILADSDAVYAQEVRESNARRR